MRKECGILHNRGRFVCSCVMVPIIIIFVSSEQILVAMGQDAKVAATARSYVCMMIPGVWAMG